MLLYTRPAIIATVKKGSPWMKYRVGTQRIGERVASVSGVMAAPGGPGSGCAREAHRRTARRIAAAFEPGAQGVERTRRVAPGHHRRRGHVEDLERVPEREVQVGAPAATARVV